MVDAEGVEDLVGHDGDEGLVDPLGGAVADEDVQGAAALPAHLNSPPHFSHPCSQPKGRRGTGEWPLQEFSLRRAVFLNLMQFSACATDPTLLGRKGQSRKCSRRARTWRGST